MAMTADPTEDPVSDNASGRWERRWLVVGAECCLLLLLFYAYAGDPSPMVNEAHYLVKAKNYWDPDWCRNDLFASSGKAHTTFYALMGWPTLWLSLESAAWVGRLVGWGLLAFGLQQLCRSLRLQRFSCVAVAAVWIAGVEHGNLAGEWVVGGIEAKVPAYGLILLGLAAMARGGWGRCWCCLGAASALHVLSGGWSVLAAMLSWRLTHPRGVSTIRLFSPGLFIGGVLSLFGLLPAVALTVGASPEDADVAARIYSFYRIKHHLLPADFYWHWYLRHALLLLVTCWMGRRLIRGYVRWQRVGWFTAGTVLIAAVGLFIGVLPAFFPDLSAKLLRFYWFRMTDAIVPLLLGLLVAKAMTDDRRLFRGLAVVAIVVAAALVTNSVAQRGRLGVPPSVSNDLLGRDSGAAPDVQQSVFEDWLAVCRWAEMSTDKDEVFLTPRHQQTFKWYAHRAEVVNWKDVPQDAESLREWYRRFQEIFPRRLGHVRVTIRYDRLREYRRDYGVRFLIVDRRVSGENLPLVRLYPLAPDANATYAVYELPTVP